MSSQIPPLLESYLSLPPETSQLVLTGILGASTNWLVLRYLYSFLKQQQQHPAAAASRPRDVGHDHYSTGAGPVQDVKVVFVSFMRDYAFWKDGAGRLGLNLDALQGKFHFVDGLSRLFLEGGNREGGNREGGNRGGAKIPAAAGAASRQITYLESPGLADVARTLHAVVDAQAARGGQAKVVLMLDQPDVLLAAAGPGDGVTSTAVRELVLDLREKTYATLLTVAADEPLVSSQTTMLEKEHAAFVLSLAHEAEAVLSLRMLDTGTAKDVSGVLRITRGGAVLDRAIDEHEYLYHVGGDGGVKVLERG